MSVAPRRSWGDISSDEDDETFSVHSLRDQDPQDSPEPDDIEARERAHGRFLAEVREFQVKFPKIQGLAEMLEDPQVQDQLYQLMGYEGCRLWTVRTGEPLPDCEEMAIPNNKYGDYLTLRRPYDILADPQVVEAFDAIKTPDEPDERILRLIDKFSRENGRKTPGLSLMLRDVSVRTVLRRLIQGGRYSLFMVTNSKLDARYLGIRVPYNPDGTYLWLKKPNQAQKTPPVQAKKKPVRPVASGFALLALEDEESE